MSLAEQLTQEIGRWADRVAELAANDCSIGVSLAAPFKTGELQQSVQEPERVSSAPFSSFTIRATAPQAEWTEYGTEPHGIDPVNGTYLKFPNTAGIAGFGEFVFTKHVDHPGNAPMPWFFPYLRENWPLWLRERADEVTLAEVA